MDRNRLYRSDCKTVAEQLKAEGVKVDLIYLDPPFNSNRTYSMIFNHGGTTAQQKAFHDMWDFTDATRQLVLDFRDELEKWDLPDSFKAFMAAWVRILEGGTASDRKLLNYLMYMTQRMIRFRDILKSTGSIYLHCDPTASHYLKVLMDGIFGRENFRNEIVWHYGLGGFRASTYFPRKHDILLFYSRGGAYTFNKMRGEPTEAMLGKYRHVAEDGRRYMLSYGKRYYFKGGKPYDTVWNVAALSPSAKERRGYNTQKPVELLNRIIQASSNPGDLVLDPFCGCGTTVHAAQVLGRRWIGVDISGDAVDEIVNRLAEISIHQSQGHYRVLEGNPDTMAEYTRLNPFEKQEWLVRRLGGLPNPKQSGDRGVDGDMTFHMGVDSQGNDTWGRLVFSVKTGKQRSPAHVRELRGTMKNERAQMGVLVLDSDPTPKMESAADSAGRFSYQPISNMPPKKYDRIQIVTAHEVIDGAKVDCPPSMQAVKRYRKAQTEMEV